MASWIQVIELLALHYFCKFSFNYTCCSSKFVQEWMTLLLLSLWLLEVFYLIIARFSFFFFSFDHTFLIFVSSCFTCYSSECISRSTLWHIHLLLLKFLLSALSSASLSLVSVIVFALFYSHSCWKIYVS